jgi:hypothetical protein
VSDNFRLPDSFDLNAAEIADAIVSVLAPYLAILLVVTVVALWVRVAAGDVIDELHDDATTTDPEVIPYADAD